MKNFVAILLVILASAYVQVGVGEEMCRSENCLPREVCESVNTLRCNNGLTCCNIVRSEFRNRCHHHGGVCVSTFCNKRLVIPRAQAIDCPPNQQCCVLV